MQEKGIARVRGNSLEGVGRRHGSGLTAMARKACSAIAAERLTLEETISFHQVFQRESVGSKLGSTGARKQTCHERDDARGRKQL
jgi:hypothetical protein